MDDNEFNIFTLQTLLMHFDVQVWSERSGEEAIRKVTEIDIDLVFMDCLMPVMDGFQVHFSP